jgi:hypothetical protein
MGDRGLRASVNSGPQSRGTGEEAEVGLEEGLQGTHDGFRRRVGGTAYRLSRTS